MAKANTANSKTKGGKPWWETAGGMAGALLAVAAVIAGLVQFALPRRAVSAAIVEGSWRPLGVDTAPSRARWVFSPAGKDVDLSCQPDHGGVRYLYEVDVELRNTGNRPITMSDRERRLLRVIAKDPRRSWERPPSIELLTLKTVAGEADAESKRNHIMQIRLQRLPLAGRAVIRAQLLSPIADLGGVFLSPEDPLFTAEPLPAGFGAPDDSNNKLTSDVAPCPS